MRQEGCDLVVEASQVAVVGLAEVVEHLPRIYCLFHKLVREAERRRPEVAVLIDFPDFNFRLAKQLHRRGIKVVYYISPQRWAWRESRIRLVQRFVDKMLVIFPFEESYYRERGVDAQFVGHPLADLPQPSVSRKRFAAQYQLDTTRTWIALLPGSRHGEVSRIFPTLLKATQLLGPEYVYIVPVASTLDKRWVASFLGSHAGPPIALTDDARATLLHARAAAVASGTSTLEAALIGTPFAMVYRVAPLTWALGRRLVKVDRFAMVNLIAGYEVVRELVQQQLTPQNVAENLRKLLTDADARYLMLTRLAEVRNRLQAGSGAGTASRRAARAVLATLEQSA
jgi:lipid-A-disaccharide synthase